MLKSAKTDIIGLKKFFLPAAGKVVKFLFLFKPMLKSTKFDFYFFFASGGCGLLAPPPPDPLPHYSLGCDTPKTIFCQRL